MDKTIIQRDCLLTTLDRASHMPATFLIAPPGAGKTVLIDQWLDRMPDRSVARLDLSVREADPTVFFRRFLMSIKPFLASSCALDSFECLLEVDASISKVSDAILRALESIEAQLLIVIEDLHWVRSPLVHQLFFVIINALPKNIHFVVSTRATPNFSMSQLRSSNKVHLVDVDHFRIQPEELSQWLNQETFQSLSASMNATEMEALSKELFDVTEGWAIAIAIASMMVKRSGVNVLNVRQGQQPEWADYFGHVVLSELSVSAQKLMCKLAILDAFDYSLMLGVARQQKTKDQSLGGIEESAVAELEAFMKQGIVVVEADNGLFRFHGLLKEFLVGRLEQLLCPSERAALDVVCSDLWKERSNGVDSLPSAINYYLKQSIDHAMASGKSEFYQARLGSIATHWAKKGYLSEAVEALSLLQDDCLVENRVLFEVLLLSLTFSRRFNQAHYYLKMAGGRLTSPMLSFLKLALNVFMNDGDYSSVQQLETLSLDPKTPLDVSALCGLIVAYYQLQRGDLDAAYASSIKAKAELSGLGYEYLGSYADLMIALCDRYLGRGLDAVRYMSKCYEPLQNKTDLPSWINIATGMIVVFYEQNQIDSAMSMCEALLPKVTFSSATEVVTTVHLHLARFCHGSGDRKRSQRILDRLDRILVLGQYQRFKSQVVQENMRQALLEGDKYRAGELVKQQQMIGRYESFDIDKNQGYSEVFERYGLSLSYFYQLHGQFDTASALLDRISEALEAQQVNARALVARCNQLVVYFSQGSKELAGSKLKLLIGNHGWEGFSRCIFDEAPGVERVFRYALEVGLVQVPEAYQLIFPNFFMVEEDFDDLSVDVMLAENQLTKKEQEIYDLLVAGLSNPKISEQLGIALSTTKWHLKNIYAKLGVDNRTSAIVMARRTI